MANEVHSSLTLFAWLDTYGPDGCCWKTSQRSLLEGEWEPFSNSWPKQGIMLGGVCYLPPQSERRTGDSDCSSGQRWPTPTARDWRSGRGRTQTDRGRTAGPSLAEEVYRREILQDPGAVHCQGDTPGTLNPQWLDWLLGFPIGWSELPPSETQSSPSVSKNSANNGDG